MVRKRPGLFDGPVIDDVGVYHFALLGSQESILLGDRLLPGVKCRLQVGKPLLEKRKKTSYLIGLYFIQASFCTLLWRGHLAQTSDILSFGPCFQFKFQIASIFIAPSPGG